MKKGIATVFICMCMTGMLACGMQEEIKEVQESVAISEESVDGEIVASLSDTDKSTDNEIIEVQEEEKKEPDLYLYGWKYNVEELSEKEDRVIELYVPEGYRTNIRGKSASVDANMAENDVSVVDFKGFANSENKNVTIEAGIADGTMFYLKNCVKLFLGTNEYESYLAEYLDYFNTRREIVPNLMEKKDVVETVYGNVQIIYILGKGADLHGEGAEAEQAFEFALINVDGCDIYFKCAYGETGEYKAILKTILPQMMPNPIPGANEGRNIMVYGEYDYIISPEMEKVEGIFGYNVPDGYTDAGEGNIKGEKENIYIQFMSEEGFPDLANFLDTGTFDEGDDEYCKIVSMEDCGTMETIYGTARIVYQHSYWDSLAQNDAMEYVIFNANGYDVVIYCYYDEMSEYRGALKELIPIMTKRKVAQ